MQNLRALAVLAAHPVQYQAPVLRHLAGKIPIHVIFGEKLDARKQGRGFGVDFEWDVPLTDGFSWSILRPTNAGSILSMFMHVREFWQRWVAERPGAVLVQGWHHPSLRAGFFTAWLLGIPILFRGENNLALKRSPAALLVHALLLRSCARVLAIGEANRQYYEFLGIPEERIVSSPYSSDTTRLAAHALASREGLQELRKKWALPLDATVFLFCGKLEPKKRPQDAVAAVANTPSSHLLVVGAGELAPVLHSSAGCSFAGFLNQSQIAEAYAAADVLVLPSDERETWGLVVNEAMACGLPVIVSDRVGCREDLVIEGETGFSYSCGDTEALRNRMIRLASNSSLRAKMGEAAQKLVRSAYESEHAAAGMERAFLEVV